MGPNYISVIRTSTTGRTLLLGEIYSKSDIKEARIALLVARIPSCTHCRVSLAARRENKAIRLGRLHGRDKGKQVLTGRITPSPESR